MAAPAETMSNYMESVARKIKSEPPAGYGYKAEIELGVGFFRQEKNGCKLLEKPIVIPSGNAEKQGYLVFFAYCNKDGIESLLSGQCPPVLPATLMEPSQFGTLADISHNFGAKDPMGSAKAGGCDYCVALRVPSEIAQQADAPGGRDIWMVQFNMDKISPFLQAAKEGNKDAVAKCLQAGVPATAVDEHGVSALMMALFAGSVETATLLLDKGADANAAEPFSGRTPLMFAAQGSSPQCVELLLARKADASKADKEGQTALMWAAVAGRAANAKALAAVGGKDATNAQGQTAKQIAENMKHMEVAAVL